MDNDETSKIRHSSSEQDKATGDTNTDNIVTEKAAGGDKSDKEFDTDKTETDTTTTGIPESSTATSDVKSQGIDKKDSSNNSATGDSDENNSTSIPPLSDSTPSTPTTKARRTKSKYKLMLNLNIIDSFVDIVLKPVGDAPILKQKRWSVDPDKEVGTIVQFIKNYLRIQVDQSLFVFVNQAFAPSPDQLIRNLYECFGSDGKLILHYSTTVAWG